MDIVRSKNYIDKNIDNFSRLVIYLSLISIAAEPQLFNPLLDECLLFQKGDLQSRENLLVSETYKKLTVIKNDEIHLYLRELVKAIDGPLSQVKSIVDINNYSSLGITIDIKACFCGRCGHEFGENNLTDDYCPICGMKREIINES